MISSYIQLGTNIGDKENNLSIATALITKHCGIFIKASSIYETAAWGKTNQENFLNQIIVIKTILPAEKLLQTLLDIEVSMGRIRQEKYGNRIIDLDILFYGNEIITSPNLTIPHPHITERKFVLIPLVEITPRKIHPVSKKSMQILLSNCTDNLEVRKK